MSVSRRMFLTCVGAGLLLPSSVMGKSSPQLQRHLNALVQKQRRQGKISSSERTAWSVYDFRSKKKLVAINEDRSMQAASMIKIFVALAYFYLHKRSPRKYPYGTTQRIAMENMLVKSSNYATNQIMKWCGGPRRVQRLCQAATGGRYKQLRVVEYIPAGGRTYRNQASAHDYSRFYYDLWHNRLPSSKELKRVLSIRNHDRITSRIMPRGVNVFDKTGSTGRLCGDAGIVQISGANKAYTFIGIIERSRKAKNYGNWISSRSSAMREVSELVYRYMKKQY